MHAESNCSSGAGLDLARVWNGYWYGVIGRYRILWFQQLSENLIGNFNHGEQQEVMEQVGERKRERERECAPAASALLLREPTYTNTDSPLIWPIWIGLNHAVAVIMCHYPSHDPYGGCWIRESDICSTCPCSDFHRNEKPVNSYQSRTARYLECFSDLQWHGTSERQIDLWGQI